MTDPAPAGQAKTEQLTFYSGDELYDWIMNDIDPRLTTKNLPKLTANGDSPLSAEDAAQYKESFAEFDKRFAQVKTAVADADKSQKRAKLLALEEQDAKETSEALKHMEQDISSLPS